MTGWPLIDIIREKINNKQYVYKEVFLIVIFHQKKVHKVVELYRNNYNNNYKYNNYFSL
jgi:hypothetical protein